ncbi:MAG TPA: ATP-dependent DNA helicase [Firmicutes bacterium]|nr:ATP-dependent DNA helicase [Candidatus Fermentithermobacillaceae bacterium]
MPRDFVNILIRAFSNGGTISSFVPGYEERPQQLEMALSVWDCLSGGGNLLVEAGTGVGKSLAYLVPAFLWTQATRKRVIVSTHTVNLQQQLVHKDLPLVAAIFRSQGFDPQYALFKGRNHYLCLRKWTRLYEDTERQLSLVAGNLQENQEDKLIEDLYALLREGTWDGDRDKLPFPVPDPFWTDIASESDRCMSSRCPYRDQCLYQKHRKHLEKCHIIVVNHALFVAHLRLLQESMGRSSLLPGFEAVVFDEAHHLEDVTRSSLATEVSYSQFKRLADDTVRLASTGSLERALGRDQLRRIRDALDDRLRALDGILRALEPAGFSGQGTLSSSSRAKSVRSLQPENGPPYQGGNRDKARIREKGSVDERFIKSLEELAGLVEQWEDMDLSDEERFEVGSLERRYLSLIENLRSINNLEGDGDSFVYWSEVQEGPRSRVTLKRSPLEIGPYLHENLWSKVPSAVLTSATLATGGSFDYMKRILSIGEAREVILGSPFEYSRQACLCVPEDSYGKDPNDPKFNDYVAEKILEIVDMTCGRMFVLFTSKKALETVSSRVKDKIEEKGYPVLIQGEAPREVLLSRFKESGKAVLFGLDSFWEGVDVPGDALSCVVLTRLPFPVPEDPVMQAREELWKSQGLVPFTQYSLPQATLKLKQGFGRLIRTKTDRGAVVILDPRIVTKHYGKSILKSLPPARLTSDIEEVRRAVPPPQVPSLQSFTLRRE